MKWLPTWERAAIEEFALQGRPLRYLLGVALALSVLAIPVVTRATGIRLPEVGAVFAIHAAWVIAANRLVYERARQSVAAFYVLSLGMVVQGAFIALALPVLAHQPSTPLWVAFTIMACAVGASETEASLLLGLFFPLAPLATVPLYLAQGHPFARAIAGPLTASFAAGYGYWYLARRCEHWRRDRHRREMAQAAARLQELEHERQRLSRDLHDSVGTTLSLVALYSALAEDRSHDAAQMQRLAATIRDAARAGLSDLRSVLQALPQGPATIGELADGMALAGQRTVEPVGAVLDVAIESGAATVVHGRVRSALVRVFQEAVHNAVRHGRAGHIQAKLAAEGGRVELEVVDDGCGFDPTLPTSPTSPGRGTGLAGMRERARELGGEITVESSSGGGARVCLALPLTHGGCA